MLEPGTWNIWGGAVDQGLTPEQAALQEVKEECGYTGPTKLFPLSVYTSGSFKYHNFLSVVDNEFTPELNWGTEAYQWVKFGNWPTPLHFGLAAILANDNDLRTILKAVKSLVGAKHVTTASTLKRIKYYLTSASTLQQSLSKAEASGFDISTLYYHGTTKRFKTFKLPKREGIDELGPGAYVTTEKWLANTWARTCGYILTCVIKKGPLIDLDKVPFDLIYQGHCKLMLELYGPSGVYTQADFKKYYGKKLNLSFVNKCLSHTQYIGGYKHDTQIPGQVVIFKPENVLVVATEPGY